MARTLLSFLKRLMPPKAIRLPEDSCVRRDRIARGVVARNAEGSVRLSQGRYCSARQIDSDFESIRHAKL